VICIGRAGAAPSRSARARLAARALPVRWFMAARCIRPRSGCDEDSVLEQ
jgi:hypothetical protein